ncbi:MATE family efflux transporter [Ruminiclostridium cellobioparum]|uniref:MATE family efflux transporter n=1 Tax=Ruminiclostridium cellobioparum TaxID=29355 RepID=UPI0028B15801|nr:MATE family efflux transporter [Ruminiclostridium cellobioparum]
MQKDNLKSEKMGTVPVGRLLAGMSLPAMLSMLVQSLYNVVDSYFVSKLGEEAFTAVSIAFPMQILTLAFAVGVGIGTNSLIARKLGEGKVDEATVTARTGLFLAILNAAAFVIIGLVASGPFISLFSDNPRVISMGTTYLTIVTAASAGMFIEIIHSKTLQATGNMLIPMISQLIGAITNIILNPILIFGLFGFPELGIAGSAVATVIGQLTAMTYVMTMFRLKSHDIHLTLKGLKLKKENVVNIYKVGAPSIVMNAIGSATTTGLNAILMSYSETAIAVLGIYFKLQSFVFMPVFGLTQGAMPIMAYNFGANKKKRFYKTFYLSLTVTIIIMSLGLLMFQLIPGQLLSIFGQRSDIGIYALKTISLCFLPAAFGIIITTMFQSVGHGMKSLVMSLLRQLVFILPGAFLFGKIFGLNGVWYCYPFAELFCVLIFTPIGFKVIREEFIRKGSFEEPVLKAG